MNAATHRYDCHNRKPFVPAYKATNGARWIQTFGKPDCQFTLSALGRHDKGCVGCVWRKDLSTEGTA